MLLSNPYRPDYRVEKEAKALRESGYEVSIVAWDREGGHKVEEVRDGIFVSRVGPRSGYDKPLDAITRLPVFWLKSFLKSRKLDFDFIHAHDLDTLVLGWFLSRLKSVRLVYDAHELYWAMVENSVPSWIRNLIQRIEKRLVPKADAVVTVTPGAAQFLESCGARRIQLVMNCEELRDPNEKRVREIRKRLAGTARKTVLYAGMIEPSRNLEPLIGLFDNLDGTEVKLVVGGTGSLASRISGLAKETENVDYIGWIPSTEMFDYVNAFDMVVMINDSRNTNIRLAISTKLFSAMAAGKPVVVSEGTADADVTRREDVGVVVPFDDLEEIRNAIMSLLRDEERLSRVAQNGKRAAREKYNWKIMKKRLINTYKELEAS